MGGAATRVEHQAHAMVALLAQKSLQMLEKWENDLGFSRKMIETAADYAFEVRKPFSYMDKLLTEWNEKMDLTAVPDDRLCSLPHRERR